MQKSLSRSTVLTSRTMEQWQFLIQKQGDRTWQSLESPYVEIQEGRYRVVARSNCANTDVEVRVTHSSPESVPPRRRIHKRSRRTNAEGLMAVIPFTYFDKGVWEIRCSGDLMSDMLGRSWQQTLQLQVLIDVTTPRLSTEPVNDDMGGVQEVGSLSSIFAAVSDSNISETPQIATAWMPVPPIPPNFAEIAPKTDSNNLDTDVNTEAIHSTSTSDFTVAPPNQAQIIERIIIDSNSHIPITDLELVSTTENPNTISQLRELQPLPGAELKEITIKSSVNIKSDEPIDTQLLPASTEAEIIPGDAIDAELLPAISTETETILGDATQTKSNEAILVTAIEASNQSHNNNIGEVAINEPVNLTIRNITELIRQNEREEAIINQLASPVWVKGDTAEQILYNLIELALPPSEPLLAEFVNQSPINDAPLPLLLTIEEQAYVARWGRPLTIYGRAQLIPTDSNLSDDASEFESVLKGELQIKLMEPQGLEVLNQVQQSLTEKLLPFGFEFTIDIPANSPSKLLLADISLYGSLSGVEDPVLLATQSFIITADVTELLTASAIAKPSEPDMLDYPLTALTPEPEPVAIDLELFNLVKTGKTAQSQVLQASPKRALPLIVEPRKSKRTKERSRSDSEGVSLKLPFSQNQDGNIALAESVSTLPFLKKRRVSPVESEISSSANDNLEDLEISADRLQIETDTATEAPELVADITHDNAATDSEVVPETDTTMLNPDDATSDSALPQQTLPPRSQLIEVNRSHMSPLIQKWIQSQGYSSSETINLQYSSLDIPNTVNAEAEKTLSYNAELPKLDTESLIVQSEPVPAPVNESLQLPNPPNIKTPPAWLAQEIVIDDTYSYIGADTSIPMPPQPEAPIINNLLNSLPILAENTEPLPIPKLILPTGDLISGRTIRVKVLLPEMRYSSETITHSQIAIKLWVEDCQTRWLLEGPHLLTNLLPSTNGKGTEVLAELNIPFGCLEIRVEAIAFDLATHQESHKATIQRAVIPPDLPTLQHDELLGI